MGYDFKADGDEESDVGIQGGMILMIEMKELKELKGKNRMTKTTMKRLKGILDKEYSYDGEIQWSFFNGHWKVQLYFENAYELPLDFIESVNSFLKNNGWRIDEICPDEETTYYFTLKRYLT